MAGTPVPLLKIIPSNANANDHPGRACLLEFERLEYYGIQFNPIQLLEFELRTHDGDLLYFEKGETLLCLTFKKH